MLGLLTFSENVLSSRSNTETYFENMGKFDDTLNTLLPN